MSAGLETLALRTAADEVAEMLMQLVDEEGGEELGHLVVAMMAAGVDELHGGQLGERKEASFQRSP